MGRKFGQSESNYLAKADLETDDGRYRAPILTIDTVTEEEVGEEKDRKYILFFRGSQGPVPKGLALNKTNETVLIDLFGDPNSADPEGIAAHLRGKQVQLYFDPSIMFGGRRVGGLRLRQPPEAPSQEPASMPPPPSEEPPPPSDGDIPF